MTCHSKVTHMPKLVPVPDAKVVPGTSSDTSQHKNTCKYESNINISGNQQL